MMRWEAHAMYQNHNIGLEILQDLKENGKPRHWRDKKVRGLKVAASFKRLGQTKKAERIFDCGTFLEFEKVLETGQKFLTNANFCRERLCPMCQWRKSLRVFYEVSRVMDACQKENPDFVPIFLTLTLRNCSDDELKSTLDSVFDSWSRFLDDRTIEKRFKGWFRTLEITHNRENGTHHPHIHCIFFVERIYFRSREYLCQKCWAWLWQKALRIDYEPIVDIQRIRNIGRKRKAISEVAKYTLKDCEFVTDDDDLTDRLVSIYSTALKGRRLHAFGGVLKTIAARFSAGDPEDGDLVHISDETIRPDVATVLERYFWHCGVNNYVKSKNA
jgi:plasmid rolling circle replication initiator protein Rep